MKLIIGLGNPGKEYANTRHNAGFSALEYLRETWGFPLWQGEKKFRGSLSSSEKDDEKITLFEPQTLMNLSGDAVALIMQFYKLEPKDILVLHDDLDIPSGELRLTESSRAAGHNGVQNIIDRLGTQDFKRIRIGIGKPTEVLGACQPHHDYVLDRFTKDEQEKLTSLLPEIERLVLEKIAG